ncbi:MAG: TonB-dependent receptor [Chitinophagaceae bacterium]
MFRLVFSLFMLLSIALNAQDVTIYGKVVATHKPIAFATVALKNIGQKTISDSAGNFVFHQIPKGKYVVEVKHIGFETVQKNIQIQDKSSFTIEIEMQPIATELNEVVVTGTLKEVKRMESPVPVEVYSAAFFKKNPTCNIFDAIQQVNGIRPQINCNICNTGDIHINGLEGPYTMVLIDGMPIVSSLSTVYGLSGIPNAMIERVEVVKGPASTLYGSEAVGGLINVITKKPSSAPTFSAEIFSTSWQEFNADFGYKFSVGKKVDVLSGANFFHYQNIVDANNDGFTDVTLQKRSSLFQKWSFNRNQRRLMNIAFRYLYEDRWGGETRWNKQFRGGDSIYGESIYTNRWEVLGNYQLPVKEKLLLCFSYNQHQQDSRYGNTAYIAKQEIGFAQLTWDKKVRQSDWLAGVAARYTYYDDNTIATENPITKLSLPQKILLPGVFIQNELSIANNTKLLLGLRYDYHSTHKSIVTPRLAFKWNDDKNNIFRVNIGTGFRVVNLFTEDHAALTGARTVEIKNNLQPEKTWNINVNYLRKFTTNNGSVFQVDASAFYTYFNNRIIADYETDVNKIIYNNLNGFGVSKGVSANIDMAFTNGIKMLVGATIQDVSTTNNGIKQQQILTENFSGVWSVSYVIKKLNLTIDYTGNVYGKMRLPLLGSLDPRKNESPVYSLQNIQITYQKVKTFSIYAGIKNLLNFTPAKGNPFIIARANDPFDKQVQYNTDGTVKATIDNPYALTFDPNYVYAPNQGMRFFIGMNFLIK